MGTQSHGDTELQGPIATGTQSYRDPEPWGHRATRTRSHRDLKLGGHGATGTWSHRDPEPRGPRAMGTQSHRDPRALGEAAHRERVWQFPKKFTHAFPSTSPPSWCWNETPMRTEDLFSHKVLHRNIQSSFTRSRRKLQIAQCVSTMELIKKLTHSHHGTPLSKFPSGTPGATAAGWTSDALC